MVKIAIPEGTKPAESFELVPNGWYPMVLAGTEYKKSTDKPVDTIQCKMEIVDGEYKGRCVFDFWTVPGNGRTLEQLPTQPKNYKAQAEISDRKVAALILAVKGEGQTCGDTDELMNIVFMGQVKVRKGTNGYEDRSELVTYAKVGDEKATKPTPGSGGNTKGKASGPAWAR